VQAPHILKVESLTKTFAGDYALRGASLELLQGEIHALVGENGAGKSTLIKILAGILSRDGGRILVDGNAVHYGTPAEARRHGIAVIHQDFDLSPNLSIADNLLLGREPELLPGVVNRREHRRLAAAYLATVGLEIDPGTLVESLTVAQRQLVAIARSVSPSSRILIMDEPTSALAPDEIAHLLTLIVKLKEGGTSVLFVSHKLDEIFRISDRITVLRDGQTIGTRLTPSTSANEIISMMVGRNLEDLFPKTGHVQHELVLQARGIRRKGVLNDVSLSLGKGEILGIYGLKGAGRTALMRTLFGLDPRDQGEIFVEGKLASIDSPRDAIRHGIGFVPKDRQTQGLFLNMNVRENLSISALDALSRLGFIAGGKERATVAQYISRLKIRTTGLSQAVQGLSGGNQQKIVLARWLINHPRVLILDEPTAGIDVGAKSEIYELIDLLASQGMGILLVSSELLEILGMSDRMLVMHGGSIVDQFSRGEATEEKVMRAIHVRETPTMSAKGN
jgi:ABC-type sugar transport system ATPase subunit